MFGSNPQPHLLLLLVLALFSLSVQSLRFELQSGHVKCIAEDIKSNSMTVGKYNITTNSNEGNPLNVTVKVASPNGNLHHHVEHVESGQFAFVAGETGLYVACFWASDHNPDITISIDFDWRTGVEAKDWSNVAKKSHVDVMTLELQKMQETVLSIHMEMINLLEQELEMQQFNWTTNTNMLWLCLLSFFICFSVAGLQLWCLKTFFEKKKIL